LTDVMVITSKPFRE